MPEIICDCCCLSNFALSDSLFLLKKLYNRSVFITDFVSAEIQRGIQSGYAELARIPRAINEGWIKEVALATKEEKSLFRILSVSLGLGEASSIAVAKSRKILFACDDRAARREAGLLGVKMTGTVGLLKRAVLNKKISFEDGNFILKEMISRGFYSTVNSLSEI